MALSAKVGSFDTGTGAVSSTVAVTGVGFTPKAVIFWWSGRTGSADAAGSASVVSGIGWATSPSNRNCAFVRIEDAVATSDNGRCYRDDTCVGLTTTTGDAIDGLLDLQSFGGDGFTLVVVDQFAASYRIHYLALGGDDLTNATTGSATEATSTGDESYTGTGFQPDCLMFIGCNTLTTNSPQANAELSIGAAVATGDAFVWVGESADNQAANTVTGGYCRFGELWANTTTASSLVAGRASLVSMDADGFTLNFAERSSTNPIYYLALKGGRYAVGSVATATDSTPFSETGVGVGTPAAVLFVSAGKLEDASDTPSAHNRLSFGAASSASDQAVIGFFDENGTADTECSTAMEHDAVYVSLATTDAVQGLMSLQSMDSDGFTMVMDDPDSGNAFVGYIAFGSEEVATTPYLLPLTLPLLNTRLRM
jgi:hypothetical protein